MIGVRHQQLAAYVRLCLDCERDDDGRSADVKLQSTLDSVRGYAASIGIAPDQATTIIDNAIKEAAAS